MGYILCLYDDEISNAQRTKWFRLIGVTLSKS